VSTKTLEDCKCLKCWRLVHTPPQRKHPFWFNQRWVSCAEC